jgi:hypothetical protein
MIAAWKRFTSWPICACAAASSAARTVPVTPAQARPASKPETTMIFRMHLS